MRGPTNDVFACASNVSPDLALALGYIPDKDTFFKFGSNDNVAATLEDVWSGGGNYPWPSAVGQVSVVSSSAEDAPGGTGVTTVRGLGIGEDGKLHDEVFALNGLTPVLSTGNFWRLYSGVCLGVQTYGGSNVGTISFTLDGSVVCQITPGQGRTRNATFTVPIDHEYMIRSIVVSSQGKPSDFRLWARPNAGVASSTYFAARTVGRLNSIQPPFDWPRIQANRLGPLTDFAVQAVTSGGSGVVTATIECTAVKLF